MTDPQAYMIVGTLLIWFSQSPQVDRDWTPALIGFFALALVGGLVLFVTGLVGTLLG